MLDFKAKCKYLVGIDSDGCAFDTMELKHKECFIPNIINHYELQGISKYAREAAEFVNLYSKSRGVNRFPALIEALEWLQRRPEVKARDFTVEIPQGLVDWIGRETRLGNPALEKAAQATGDPGLRRALAWSQGINASVAEMVRGVPPFPFVRESIQKLSSLADVLVVSATPQEALQREWEEHELTLVSVDEREELSGVQRSNDIEWFPLVEYFAVYVGVPGAGDAPEAELRHLGRG